VHLLPGAVAGLARVYVCMCGHLKRAHTALAQCPAACVRVHVWASQARTHDVYVCMCGHLKRAHTALAQCPAACVCVHAWASQTRTHSACTMPCCMCWLEQRGRATCVCLICHPGSWGVQLGMCCSWPCCGEIVLPRLLPDPLPFCIHPPLLHSHLPNSNPSTPQTLLTCSKCASFARSCAASALARCAASSPANARSRAAARSSIPPAVLELSICLWVQEGRQDQWGVSAPAERDADTG